MTATKFLEKIFHRILLIICKIGNHSNKDLYKKAVKIETYSWGIKGFDKTPILWYKTTLITGVVGGAVVGPPSRKMGKFSLT